MVMTAVALMAAVVMGNATVAVAAMATAMAAARRQRQRRQQQWQWGEIQQLLKGQGQ
jgi:hypothetical protein